MTRRRHRYTPMLAIHPSVRRQVAEWLDEAAQDASDESVRQQAGSPHRGAPTNDRRPTP